MQKRFIAGAVCPKCGAMDTLKAWHHEQVQYRECVACDFKDELQENPQVAELATRVNQTPVRPEDEISLVKILG
ncbi:hypothetical protein SAMN05421831_103195 [Allopseudospirillum japonicum]|uniref:Uncharacterized protein n=1 Tax=Allopseudospirillum japonicum TaxID=64971 RepID=A0A1H6RL66_9GAMM|nr:YheV family putative zinc ribbon protein [Allopseudospirillum japonicum]SEI52550.1 hypothetical protein SAMN05421831_103195 [Allopseudospirillum japonicum]